MNAFITIAWVTGLFVYTKYDCKISWSKASVGLVAFVSFNIALDSLLLLLISFLGFDFQQLYVFILYFAAILNGAICLSTALLIHYIRDGKEMIRPEKSETLKNPLQGLFTNNYLFLVALFLIFIIYVVGMSLHNINKVVNSLFLFITFLVMLLVFYGQIVKNKKQYQALYVKHLESEANNLSNYTKTVDSLYNDIRHYKHDIQNVLLGVRLYIDNDDMETLRKFYYSEVLSLSPINNPVYNIISCLQPLRHVSLKGVIFSKIETTLGNNIEFQVEMLDQIDHVPIKSVDLCRIVGILLDNAIESAAEGIDKKLCMSMDIQDNKTRFVILNTYSKAPDLEKLYQLQYSTKGKNRGLGLHSLKSILAKYPNSSLSYRLEDKYFCSVLEIENT